MTLVYWRFVEARDEGQPVWTWKTVGPDGTAQVSQRFSSFGAVMRNAISWGFDPRAASWEVATSFSTTRHEPPGGLVRRAPRPRAAHAAARAGRRLR